MNNVSIFDHTLISRSHYLHGSLLEDMIQENMSKFMDRMAKETGPFEPKQYISLMVFHQLYTVCFGERCVFNFYSVILINLHFKPAFQTKMKSMLKHGSFFHFFFVLICFKIGSKSLINVTIIYMYVFIGR